MTDSTTPTPTPTPTTPTVKRTLFLPSCRPQLMRAFLDSLDYLPGWDLLVAFQEYSPEDWALLRESHNFSRITDYIEYPERRFPYPTRVEMYKRWYSDYDVWCSMDDDMELLPSVDYEPMMRTVLEPSVGVVSGNWVKHESWLKRVKPVAQFVEQPLTNMAGGQMFSRKVVDVLLNSPVEPYLFCDVQVALNAYVAGYRNFRYRGSMIIHRIMQKDGLQRTFRLHSMTLPDPRYLAVRAHSEKFADTDNNYHMPENRDVQPLAHAQHTNNRARLARLTPTTR